nr:hypothetical protein [Tanacetum cinerariifolium]
SFRIVVGNRIHLLIKVVEMDNKDETVSEDEMENEDEAEAENDGDETENENDGDETENENDGDEVEAEARVLRICRFYLSTQTFKQIECNGVYHRPVDGD